MGIGIDEVETVRYVSFEYYSSLNRVCFKRRGEADYFVVISASRLGSSDISSLEFRREEGYERRPKTSTKY